MSLINQICNNNPVNIDGKTTFLNDTLAEKTSYTVYSKQKTSHLFRHCYHIVKQMTEILPFDVLAQISTTKESPLLPSYQTPVNKSESFNVRSKKTESADVAISN